MGSNFAQRADAVSETHGRAGGGDKAGLSFCSQHFDRPVSTSTHS